jgi:hypothetical protein
MLIEHKISFNIYPPTTIKKFVGHGRYTKDDMVENFKNENVKLAYQMKHNEIMATKPFDDLVDAYFICKKLKHDLKSSFIKTL